jgi:hypothetical protein
MPVDGLTSPPRKRIRERADGLARYWRDRPHSGPSLVRFTMLAAKWDWLRLLAFDGKATPADLRMLAELVPQLRGAVAALTFDRFAPADRPLDRHHLPHMLVDSAYSFFPHVTTGTGHLPGDTGGELLGKSWVESARQWFA